MPRAHSVNYACAFSLRFASFSRYSVINFSVPLQVALRVLLYFSFAVCAKHFCKKQRIENCIQIETDDMNGVTFNGLKYSGNYMNRLLYHSKTVQLALTSDEQVTAETTFSVISLNIRAGTHYNAATCKSTVAATTFSNRVVTCLHYEHCGATSVRV
jgi:hypothetical protein